MRRRSMAAMQNGGAPAAMNGQGMSPQQQQTMQMMQRQMLMQQQDAVWSYAFGDRPGVYKPVPVPVEDLHPSSAEARRGFEDILMPSRGPWYQVASEEPADRTMVRRSRGLISPYSSSSPPPSDQVLLHPGRNRFGLMHIEDAWESEDVSEPEDRRPDLPRTQSFGHSSDTTPRGRERSRMQQQIEESDGNGGSSDEEARPKNYKDYMTNPTDSGSTSYSPRHPDQLPGPWRDSHHKDGAAPVQRLTRLAHHDSCINITISRDNTTGDDARQAALLAEFAQLNRRQPLTMRSLQDTGDCTLRQKGDEILRPSRPNMHNNPLRSGDILYSMMTNKGTQPAHQQSNTVDLEDVIQTQMDSTSSLGGTYKRAEVRVNSGEIKANLRGLKNNPFPPENQHEILHSANGSNMSTLIKQRDRSPEYSRPENAARYQVDWPSKPIGPHALVQSLPAPRSSRSTQAAALPRGASRPQPPTLARRTSRYSNLYSYIV